jgi:hypothetical protein
VRSTALAALLFSTALAAQGRDEALHQTFARAHGTRFIVLFDGERDERLATRSIEVLEEAYERIGLALGTFPQRTITVVLYTQQQFQDITRAPAWAAGAYDGRIRLPVRGALERPAELGRVLFHELAHAMVESVAPRGVPTWLGEGLAVMFEPDGAERTHAELASSPQRLPFSRLARTFRGLSPEEARIAYAQSSAIARMLFDQAGGPTVVAILRDLAAGQSFEAAYEQRLFLPFHTFLESLDPERSPF